MTSLLLSLAISPALGAGLQARLEEGGIGAVERILGGYTFEVAVDDLQSELGCFGRIGVKNFNLSVPVRSVALTLGPAGLGVEASFDRVSAEDMTVYGTDADFPCIDFHFPVRRVTLENGTLSASLSGGGVDGLGVWLPRDPVIHGNLYIDADPPEIGVDPTDAELLDALGAALAAKLPAWLEKALDERVLSAAFGKLRLGLLPSGSTADADHVAIGVEGGLSWENTDGCVPDFPAADPSGRTSLLDIPVAAGNSALAIDEEMANRALTDLWRAGLFCLSDADVGGWLAGLGGAVDLSGGDTELFLSLDAPPKVEIEASGISLSARVVRVEVKAGGEVVLSAEAAVTAVVRPVIDTALATVGLEVVGVSLSWEHFEATHLVSDAPDAEAHLQDFLGEWLSGWAARQPTLTVGRSGYQLLDLFAVRVEGLRLDAGLLAADLSLYAIDDQAVDRSAPDTSVEVTDARILFGGSDPEGQGGEQDGGQDGDQGRTPRLAYSWRVDGGAWSDWTAEQSVALPVLKPGGHEVEVKARDSWWNEDPTPARARVRASEAPGGCASGATTGKSGMILGLLAMLLVAARRPGGGRAG